MQAHRRSAWVAVPATLALLTWAGRATGANAARAAPPGSPLEETR